MVQVIDDEYSGNILGRIGKGLGKSLAEQVPKEVERYRLSSGLEALNKEQGLSPKEYFTKALSIPGVGDRPEVVRQLSELSKHENIRNAYGKAGMQGQEPLTRDVANTLAEEGFRGQQIPGTSEKAVTGKEKQRQILEKNPLREEAQPKGPWTPEERNAEKYKISQQFPWMNPEEVSQQARENEVAERERPTVEQQRDASLRAVQEDLNNKFTSQLETALQKEGKETFKDVTGEMQLNIRKAMENDLRSNPGANTDQIVKKWVDKSLDVAKAKNNFKKLASNTGYESLFKGEQTLNQLKQYSKIFKDAGNSEEYFNILQNEMGFSPQAAASIAYEPNPTFKEYVNKIKPLSEKDIGGALGRSVKYANDIENYIGNNDSILAFAKYLRDKDPFFDQQAFFKRLLEIQGDIGLNDRQKREIAEGPSDIFANWADLLFLPFKKS